MACGDIADVATDHSVARGKVYRDCARTCLALATLRFRRARLGMSSRRSKSMSSARSLKIEKARVVGHDIGLMVAYAYAAQFPNETEKLVVMDAFLPGVEDGKRSTMRRTFGISVSTASIRRSRCKGGSALTSSISGMCFAGG